MPLSSRAILPLLLAAALFSGCQTRQGPIDDTAITAVVKSKLAAEFGPIEARQERQEERGADQQPISYISVTSVNGIVTLTGEVSSNRAKARAAEIARKADHVVTVNNNLAVAPKYSDDAVGAPR